jgi:hypothetical protein
MLLAKLRTVSPFRSVAMLMVMTESRWFDFKHNVLTRATGEDRLALQRSTSAGFSYLPTRPAAAREMLRELPIQSHASYTFVDFGSGRGRMLLLAGEYPFEQVEGIELNAELHEAAEINLLNHRGFNMKCGGIKSCNIIATDYYFPNRKLVLYFFNPFGDEIMQRVLGRLDESLEQNPRDVLVVIFYPELAGAADRSPHLQICKQSSMWKMYRSRLPLY